MTMVVLSIFTEKVGFFIDDDGPVRVVLLFSLLAAEEISLRYTWDTSTGSDGSLKNHLALGPASTSASHGRKQPTKSTFSTGIFKLSKFWIM